MRTLRTAMLLSISLFSLDSLTTINAQGTLTFNDPWINNGIGYLSLSYWDGLSFNIRNRTTAYAPMAQVGATGPSGYAHNGTPYIAFANAPDTPQYVAFAWTNAAAQGHSFTDGTPFGLASVDLADPVAPSLAPVAITFNGFKLDGSTVSQTFTVGGGGSSSFQTFQFSADFAVGLTRVEIPSAAWAMDNLVWIPEPNTAALILVGVLVIIARRTVR